MTSSRCSATAYACRVVRVAIPNLATKSEDRKELQKKRWSRAWLVLLGPAARVLPLAPVAWSRHADR